jgi:hypothetical protein
MTVPIWITFTLTLGGLLVGFYLGLRFRRLDD